MILSSLSIIVLEFVAVVGECAIVSTKWTRSIVMKPLYLYWIREVIFIDLVVGFDSSHSLSKSNLI